METYNLSQYIAGDTWNGISGVTITRDNSALDLTGAYAEMKVKFQLDAPTVAFFSTSNGTMVISQPASAGIIVVPPQIVDIPPANYVYTIKVTLSSGQKDTFVTGIWPVVKYT
jgi:hypothetical protein